MKYNLLFFAEWGGYCLFHRAPVVVENAIETPASLKESIRHTFTFWLGGNRESTIRHKVNGNGDSAHKSSRKATLNQ